MKQVGFYCLKCGTHIDDDDVEKGCPKGCGHHIAEFTNEDFYDYDDDADYDYDDE